MSTLKDLYTRTPWVDGSTPVSADNLNNIECGIERLYESSLTSADIVGADGVIVETTDDGKVKLRMKASVVIITEELEEYEPNVIYFLLSESGTIRKIIINGISSNYGVGL